jgi:hypothetical protein
MVYLTILSGTQQYVAPTKMQIKYTQNAPDIDAVNWRVTAVAQRMKTVYTNMTCLV